MSARSLKFVSAFVGVMVLSSLGFAQRSDILPGERRKPTVEAALKIVQRVQHAPLAEDINNPFFPNSLKKPVEPLSTADTEMDVSEPVYRGPSNDFELLEVIAPEINPTGTMILGGYPLLLFGQKKVKVGDVLPVIYNTQRYTLIISAIEGSNFTLRLGDAELTRSTKSSK
jgi:hypothetical protein